jgi:radical SAM superfamily enzyme YgiQ (UPF0313 family)
MSGLLVCGEFALAHLFAMPSQKFATSRCGGASPVLSSGGGGLPDATKTVWLFNRPSSTEVFFKLQTRSSSQVQMNSLLIYPEFPDTYWSFKHALPFEGKRSAYPPLGLLTVASLLPASWNKRVVDANVRKVTEDDIRWADIALFSGMLVQKPHMLELLDMCRRAGVRTVVGGPITSGAADMCNHADHVIVGEGEETVPAFLRDLEAGTAQRVYNRARLPELKKTPVPDMSLIDLKPYSAMAIQYSRGCPFNCEFCDIIEIYGRRPRTKSVAQVIAELDQLYDMKWRGSVFIVDDNFIGNKKNVRQLMPALADWNRQHGRPFTFFTEASVNLADDVGLLGLMREAGFTRVFLGIETPVESSLREAQKLQNTKRSLLESVLRIQSFGIEVMAGFIVGFDHDPDDIFDKQVEFIEESAIPLAMVGLLQALPGTQLYRRLSREGRLLADGNGNNSDIRLNFVPNMNPERLIAGYRSIMQRLYTQPAYYERVRKFLERFKPAYHRPRALTDYAAFARSVVKQGLMTKGRRHYWRFLWDAATRYRHAFDTAIVLAVMGYHFETLTRKVIAEASRQLDFGSFPIETPQPEQAA